MTQHTEGRWRISGTCALITEDGAKRIAEVHGGTGQRLEPDREEAIANAERLAACWNAFSGTSGDPETLLSSLIQAARGMLLTTETDFGSGLDTEVAIKDLRAALAPFEEKPNRV